ncbi:hypothetical protein KIH87_11220 [Paraneptunicella aestuarii]|nr:hypothetical protein [Paraneptunicella aestuarii]UAA37301.1 hypothetical protein KIH87_11220 [Paraneptunicella aestuarii]
MQKNQDLKLVMKFVYWAAIIGIVGLVGYIGWMIFTTVSAGMANGQ